MGAKLFGSFRDAENPDCFVWLRGMSNMAERKRILTAFYTNGEMWKENRKEVNSWIVDSDNVLLVRAVTDWAEPASGDSIVGMYTHVSRDPQADLTELQRTAPAAIEAAGGRLLVTLSTDPSENNYPRHPIRTGEYGFIWFASFTPGHDRPLGLHSVEERRLLPTKRSWMR